MNVAADSVSLRLARHYAGLGYDAIPKDVVAEAKRLLLDTVACVVAAESVELAGMVRQLARMLGVGALAGGADCMGRAFEIGRLGNLMDFDEAYPAGCHFGAGAVAGALTTARLGRLSGRRLLTALVAGYEAGGQVAVGIGPYFALKDGKVERFLEVWGIATPVVFAAAAAAAHGLGLTPELTNQAWSVAGSNTPIPIGGKWTTEVELPNTKYCDTGWCALTGVFGAVAASEGTTAVPALLDGDRGLIRIVGGADWNSDRFLAKLGTRWHLRHILYKRYPCCRWIHYPLNALETLMARHGLVAGDVREVVVEIGTGALSRRFTNPDPANFVSLQFSIPHAVAMMLSGEPPGPGWLSAAAASDPAIAALRQRVRVEAHAIPWSYSDPFSDADVPRTMIGAVRVDSTKGRFREERDWAWGDSYRAEGRADDAAMAAKVRAFLRPADADRILGLVDTLEQLDDASPLVEAIYAAMDGAARG